MFNSVFVVFDHCENLGIKNLLLTVVWLIPRYKIAAKQHFAGVYYSVCFTFNFTDQPRFHFILEIVKKKFMKFR